MSKKCLALQILQATYHQAFSENLNARTRHLLPFWYSQSSNPVARPINGPPLQYSLELQAAATSPWLAEYQDMVRCGTKAVSSYCHANRERGLYWQDHLSTLTKKNLSTIQTSSRGPLLRWITAETALSMLRTPFLVRRGSRDPFRRIQNEREMHLWQSLLGTSPTLRVCWYRD